MDSAWDKAFNLLNENLPLRSLEPGFPSLASALDDSVDDLLRDSLVQPSPANPHYVEDLLRDCVDRISNCLVLREKAQDVELRATGEALNYKIQEATVEMQQTVDKLLRDVTPRTVQSATGVSIEGGKVTFVNDDAEAWQKVASAHDKLYMELREALAIQKAKASAPSNGSNFVERFAFLKKLFDLNLVEAYRRSVVAARALKDIYAIDVPLPKVTKHGYLNEISLWAQRASDLLDDALDARLFSDVVFAVSGVDGTLKDQELVPRERFTTELATGRLTFKLTPTHFERCQMRDPLLRSVRLQVQCKDETRVRIWPAQVYLPKSRPTGRVEVVSSVMPSVYQDTPDESSVIRSIHNISPVGDWEIRLPERSITPEAATALAATKTTEIVNIYVYLRLSYARL